MTWMAENGIRGSALSNCTTTSAAARKAIERSTTQLLLLAQGSAPRTCPESVDQHGYQRAVSKQRSPAVGLPPIGTNRAPRRGLAPRSTRSVRVAQQPATLIGYRCVQTTTKSEFSSRRDLAIRRSRMVWRNGRNFTSESSLHRELGGDPALVPENLVPSHHDGQFVSPRIRLESFKILPRLDKLRIETLTMMEHRRAPGPGPSRDA